MRLTLALLCGVLFGLGLAASGMTNTAKVIGFLDVFGAWDADLMFVMGSALITTAIGFALATQRTKPWFSERFFLPTKTAITPRLVTGAALFGAGWGLFGYCPGPALAALVYGSSVTVVFVVMMVLGLWLANRFVSEPS